MDAFTIHTGTAAPLHRSNVDTDQIIPAEYLKRITRHGFEDALFALVGLRTRILYLIVRNIKVCRFWSLDQILGQVLRASMRCGPYKILVLGWFCVRASLIYSGEIQEKVAY